jgi:hypothetical protein
LTLLPLLPFTLTPVTLLLVRYIKNTIPYTLVIFPNPVYPAVSGTSAGPSTAVPGDSGPKKGIGKIKLIPPKPPKTAKARNNAKNALKKKKSIEVTGE